MTAATWKQAKQIAGCACTRSDPMYCAIEQGYSAGDCECPCHGYVRVDAPAPQPAPRAEK